MLVVMDKKATSEEIKNVVSVIEERGYTARPIPGGERVSIGILNNKGPIDALQFLSMPGVKDAIAVTRPYKLVSREVKHDDTVIQVGDAVIGGDGFTIMAGPCAVESETQALSIAGYVKKSGAHIFRGGAFKPRTSPYAFQGLGEKGVEILQAMKDEFGVAVVTEIVGITHIEKTFIAQGTLRPDLIESASELASDKADVIKTHHNDTKLVREKRS